MTVCSLIKGIFIMASLMGVIFIGAGVFKLWSAYNFAKTAEMTTGTFSGYKSEYHESSTPYDDMPGSSRLYEATYPLFTFVDKNGNRRLEKDPESHFIKRFEHGDQVTVLTSPAGTARLGDAFSLFGGGIGMCFIGIAFIFLMNYGIKTANTFLGPPDPIVHESEPGFRSSLRDFGQSRFPVSDVVIILGGFILVTGGLFGAGAYYALKRSDQSLINAIQNNDVNKARVLAADGRGIDAKDKNGDSALIMALKANQSEVARAVLTNLFVSASAVSSDGFAAAHLAAVNGDHRTLAVLLIKGAMVFDIKQSAVYDLIEKNDYATLKVIFDKGYPLDGRQGGLTLGDHAVMLCRSEIVELIRMHNGVFQAPSSFIALAINDADALNKALQATGASAQVFNRTTLRQFAEKIGRLDLLAGK